MGGRAYARQRVRPRAVGRPKLPGSVRVPGVPDGLARVADDRATTGAANGRGLIAVDCATPWSDHRRSKVGGCGLKTRGSTMNGRAP